MNITWLNIILINDDSMYALENSNVNITKMSVYGEDAIMITGVF